MEGFGETQMDVVWALSRVITSAVEVMRLFFSRVRTSTSWKELPPPRGNFHFLEGTSTS